MTRIDQPETDDILEQVVSIYRNDDGVTVRHTRAGLGGAGFTLDPHRARQFYNALGAMMGFDKPPAARTPARPKWEEITVDEYGAGHTYRLAVEGGWLYRTVTTHPNYDDEDDLPVAVSTTFVPRA